MTASERREKILSLVNQTEGIKSSELAERLSVTTETIRKDLIYLEQKKAPAQVPWICETCYRSFRACI